MSLLDIGGSPSGNGIKAFFVLNKFTKAGSGRPMQIQIIPGYLNDAGKSLAKSLSRTLISSRPSKIIINFFSFFRLLKQDLSLSTAVPLSLIFSVSNILSAAIIRSIIKVVKLSRLQRALSPTLNLYGKMNVLVFLYFSLKSLIRRAAKKDLPIPAVPVTHIKPSLIDFIHSSILFCSSKRPTI